MGYTAQTFVADEQPTTAKWNLLWANDASFNDGTGIANDAILSSHILAGELLENVNYQTDNSNTIASNTNQKVKLQMGWNQAVGTGASAFTVAVTFPTAFTTVLGVVTSLNAVKSTTAASGLTDTSANYHTGSEVFGISAGTVTASGFTANLARTAGSYAGTTYYLFSWIAWGIA